MCGYGTKLNSKVTDETQSSVALSFLPFLLLLGEYDS